MALRDRKAQTQNSVEKEMGNREKKPYPRQERITGPR